MKNIVSLVSIVLVLIFSGCGGSSGDDSSPSNTTDNSQIGDNNELKNTALKFVTKLNLDEDENIASLGIYGDTIAVGRASEDYFGYRASGYVYLFKNYERIEKLKLPDSSQSDYANFGETIAISNNLLAVESSKGGFRLYDISDSSFNLIPNEISFSSSFDDTNILIKSIDSVTNVLIIGDKYADKTSYGSRSQGSIKTYLVSNNNINLMDSSFSSVPDTMQHFGSTMYLTKDTLIVGSDPYSKYDDTPIEIFHIDDNGYLTLLQTILPPQQTHSFGNYITANENYLVIGAPNEEILGYKNAGAIYIYIYI